MWWWILVWVLLVVGACAVLTLVVWRLVGQAIALGRELATTADRFSTVLSPLHEPYTPAASVLADPSKIPAGGPTRGRRA